MQALGSHNFPCIHFKLHSVTNFKVRCPVLDIIISITPDEGPRWAGTIETSTLRVVNLQVSFKTFQARIASKCVFRSFAALGIGSLSRSHWLSYYMYSGVRGNFKMSCLEH